MQFKLINIEKKFNPNTEITNIESLDKKKKFTIDGLYSEKIFGNMYGSKIEYKCNCGEIIGEYNEGLLCKLCNSIVSKKECQLLEQGWINLGNYKVINPLYYAFLKRYFGEAKLKKYLSPQYVKIDKDGNEFISEDDIPKNENNSDLISIGINTLAKNFIEILDYFKETNKNINLEVYEFLKQNKDNIFTSKIPVFSHRLRPATVVGQQIMFDKSNTIYVQILKIAKILNALSLDAFPLNVDKLLYKIQELYNSLYDYIITTLANSETGHIRNEKLSNRFNFSARCVIVPLHHNTKIDEVHIPYVVGCELLKLHIIRKLVQNKGMTYNEANMRWRKGILAFDREIYDIILEIEEDEGGIHVLINRNPTINIGSILKVTAKVKDVYDDYCMGISNNVLSVLSADFDGDTLNLYLAGKSKYITYKYNPKNIIFSLNDGRLNSQLLLAKDHRLGLSTLIN